MPFELSGYLKSRLSLVEAALKSCVPKAEPRRLHDAMRYSLLAGGKRLRPLLVMASAEACGASAKSVLGAACAFECLHTYSLIHDDLPAMDDDDLRRGKPTSHKAFDEATAILAGDALLTLAFELMASSRGKASEALRVFAQASGSRGMVGGQMADIQAEGRRVGPAQLKAIHAGKTGALIRAAVECGAILAGAPQARRQALAAFGSHIGLAFQVADDILNVTGDAAKLGKKTGSDAGRGKATYPSLFGLEKSRKMAAAELAGALDCLRPFGKKAEPLAALARFVVERDR
jgi:geranylgeranyl diphosphate synthase type II